MHPLRPPWLVLLLFDVFNEISFALFYFVMTSCVILFVLSYCLLFITSKLIPPLYCLVYPARFYILYQYKRKKRQVSYLLFLYGIASVDADADALIIPRGRSHSYFFTVLQSNSNRPVHRPVNKRF